jgi:3',5'-cyclic AMP phosphodiesterase CpdA
MANQDNGFECLLFDSGRRCMFRARCRDITWDNTRTLIPSPELEHTPVYYRNQTYLAWFKITAIDDTAIENAETLLRTYSYVQVDAFFDAGKSRYRRFYGKRVASLEELRQQDRTIWFIEEAAATAPSHEILLLDAHSLTPSHFPEFFYQSTSRQLLWVSDLHFGNHAFPLADTPATVALAYRIEDALVRHLDKNIGGLIVSGDVTWSATPEQYAQAKGFLAGVNSWARLHNYQLAVCPGNHDICFSKDPAKKDEPVAYPPEEARKAFAQFYDDLFYLAPNEYLCSGRRFLLGGEVPIEVVCLNSSLLKQTPGWFQGHGFIGDRQLEHAAEAMGWGQGERVGPVRMLVVHHHLLPVTYREEPIAGRIYSVALDAEALVRWIIRYQVQIVLHGHMHQLFYSRVTRSEDFTNASQKEHTFHVFGLGSTGVDEEHLGELKANMFAVLSFTRDSMTVDYYSVHRTNPSQHIRQIAIPLWSAKSMQLQ